MTRAGAGEHIYNQGVKGNLGPKSGSGWTKGLTWRKRERTRKVAKAEVKHA